MICRTHDQEEAKTVPDKIVALKDGISCIGVPLELST
jgi:ABC-type sulfate/molybdate transport systems ATPase subunit